VVSVIVKIAAREHTSLSDHEMGESIKHLHCGFKTVEIATYTATSLFNEDSISLLQIMQVLNISIGLEASNYAQNADAITAYYGVGE
jgi:hypothetical protein